MSEHVILNHKQHSDLKIIDKQNTSLSEKANFAMVFPIEFRDVQGEYPIFFHKNVKTGAFYPVSLFGLEPEENLFVSEQGWDASYLPLMIRKQPFFIGKREADSVASDLSLVVTLDPDNPRVSTTEGEAVFNQDGSPTDFLSEKMEVLERVHQGHEHSEKFVQALVEHDLIEPFVLELSMTDESTRQMLGFFTINEEKVQALPGDVLAEFASQGFLISLFMVMASHSNLGSLIRRKAGI
ncbi:MAG: SapC family protein [Acidiferrobacterales bacterium]|nr:SapC family protein [Acidiferrobacterales bacterium]